jgi:hypothetical protein
MSYLHGRGIVVSVNGNYFHAQALKFNYYFLPKLA